MRSNEKVLMLRNIACSRIWTSFNLTQITLICKTHSSVVHTFFPSFFYHLMKRQYVRIAWISLKMWKENKWVSFFVLRISEPIVLIPRAMWKPYEFYYTYVIIFNDVQKKKKKCTAMKILHIRLCDMWKPIIYFFLSLSDPRFNINDTQIPRTAKLMMKLMQVAARDPFILARKKNRKNF